MSIKSLNDNGSKAIFKLFSDGAIVRIRDPASLESDFYREKNFGIICYDPAVDRDKKYPNVEFYEVDCEDESKTEYILSMDTPSPTNEQYDNAFLALSNRKNSDIALAKLINLYSSIRGYLGW